jgi:hypothetical protein
VKNSTEFCQQLKDVTLQRNEVLVSFDVISLFPSVPVEAAIEDMQRWFQEINLDVNKLNVYTQVAKCCLRSTFFQFRERFYHQESGLSMGNPLSPILANIFMCYFERKMQQSDLFPRVWVRYVDDVFAVVKSRKVKSLFEFLNAQHPTIKFTMEEEIDGILAFLDVSVKRIDNKLDFKIYRKPKFTCRFITSDSFHSFQQKNGCLQQYGTSIDEHSNDN